MLHHFAYRSPPVDQQNPVETDQPEDPIPIVDVRMNQTRPTGANRTRSVGATISTAAQHASPKLLPSSCANGYSQSSLVLLIAKIVNPQRKSFVLSL